DQIAEAGKRVGERDDSVVDRERRRALGGGNLDARRLERGGAGGRAESGPDLSIHRPVKGTSERSNRQRRRFQGSAARELTKRGLQLLLSANQLARQLSIQISAAIDIVNEIGARSGGGYCRLLCAIRIQTP